MYAGTSDGHICHFVVDKHSDGGKTRYDARMNAKQSVGQGKKPVEQLGVIAAQRKLLVLCGKAPSFSCTSGGHIFISWPFFFFSFFSFFFSSFFFFFFL